MTELLDRLEHRLKLAERHGPIVAGREVYIRATDLREVVQALRDGEKREADDALSEREAMLFDLAWNLVTAVRGGGTLPHRTPEQRADEAAVALTYLLDARNARSALTGEGQ